MLWERTLLHFNVADFAVAVERVVDQTLKRRPVIVAPLGSARAVVYDMSEEAYQSGVRKGMALCQAARLCREAAQLPPRPELYRKAMQGVLKEARLYSPLVEHGVEDGHIFVDVTGTHRLFGPAPDVGLRIRRQVRDGLGLNPIWALASNKLVAKVASRLVKPVGEYIVAPGEEEAFLAPLAVSLLPGLTVREVDRLLEFRIGTVGQLAGLSRQQLMVPFGSRSTFLHNSSRGIDTSQVTGMPLETAPIDCEHVFASDTNDRQEVEAALLKLVATAGQELRNRGQVARRVGIWLRYADSHHIVRQASTHTGTASDFLLRRLADLALERAWLRRTRLRGLRLVCDRLHRQSSQLSLFPETKARSLRQERLLGAMDTIRSRCGQSLIGRGKIVSAENHGTVSVAVSN
ncbi:MAG: hypothetical protein P4L42_08020 [Desulfocapsaceae bacterium]|nr:hypothetical protein [Desulfocapsaceae bacterium]